MAKRPSDRRLISLRLGQTGIDRIDKLAADAGVDRSVMLRRLLAFATAQFEAGKGKT